MSNVPTNLIPTRITGLPEYLGSSTLGYMPYIIDGRTYKVQFTNIAAVGAVPSTRQINTGSGLGGGGDLSANRTLYILPGGVDDSMLTSTGVTAGTYGSAENVPVLTVNAQGRVTSATNTPIVLTNYVPTSRTITAGTGLSGGGDLSANRSFAVNFSSTTPEPLGPGSPGVSTVAAREDHVHPAVDLSDTTETQGVLPLSRGGTGNSLSPVVGAIAYSSNDKLYLTPTAGSVGQVLVSAGGLAPPEWQTISGAGTVTSVNASGGTTGLSFTGGPITTSGTLTLGGTLAVANGGTGATDAATALTNLGAYPASNPAGYTSNVGTVTSVSGTGTVSGLSLSGTVTSAGSLTLGGTLVVTPSNFASQTANTVLAAPNGSAGTPTFRAIVAADIPTLNQNTTGTAGNVSGVVAVANGGTGASVAGTARTNLSAAASGANTDITSIALTTGTVSTAPASNNDIANKQYVDTVASSGIHFHQPVRVESPINLNATYNNGTAGVGATLTNAGTQAALVIDGVTVSAADRVLVYEQTDATQNGIYVVTDTGSGSTNWVLTRSSDADTYVNASPDGLSEGSTVFVQQGTTGAGETYTCNTPGTITFGTTNITFAQISSAQIYSAGTGLTLAGTQFSITNTGLAANTYGSASAVPVIAFNAQGQATSVTNTSIAISGSQITSGSVAVANGGTGATDAATALTNLGAYPASNPNGYTSNTGTVTSVSGTGTVNGITLTGSVTTSGSLTLGGTLSGVDLTSQVTGTLPVANGGTGATTLTANNVLLGNGTSAVQVVAPGTAGNVLTSDGTTWTSAAPTGGGADIQEFAASGTWTKPAGAQFVLVECWGAGGGGGSGRRGAASSGRSGGGGGGGGSYTYRTFEASDLSATETVTIGAGGTGGASVTADSTSGNAGTTGGNTTFGTKLAAYGGFGGSGGLTTAGQAGAGGSVFAAGSSASSSAWPAEYAFNGSGGGQGDDAADAVSAPCAFQGGAGGGGGGGASSANTPYGGGAGGSRTGLTGGGGDGGNGSTIIAGDGDDGVTLGFGGGGGGGIHRATALTGGAGTGGNGGIAGGGGGGGNGVNALVNSGAGGAGGAGYCRVYTW